MQYWTPGSCSSTGCVGGGGGCGCAGGGCPPAVLLFDIFEADSYAPKENGGSS